ncbi:MAG: TonB-dependent receptor [Ignavibacteriales bacterium]|nr:TonB-dependent receptor [Ignavibacteriales bacterium]
MKRILFLLISIPYIVFAGTTGKVIGIITDEATGEPLVGANIILEGTNLGASTDLNGNYVVLNVPPGSYNIKVSSIGYGSVVTQNVKIVVDQTTNLSVSLKSTALEVAEVIVTAKTPLIQKDITSTVSVMTRDEIESLPVASFTELLSMQAGVVGSGSNLHIRGGRSNEVAYMVDGMYVQDPLLGGLATQINNDAIQEMSLLSGTFNAEYGNALSGVVNIVTREGSDKFFGKIEIRSSEFGVKEYSKLHELRINGSFGGPLFSKDIKFFISGEQNKQGSYLPFGYNKDITMVGKLSFTFIPSVKITLSNRGSVGRSQEYSHDYKYIPERWSKNETDSYQGMLTLTHTIASNFFYDLRVSYFNQGYYRGFDHDTSNYIPETDFEYIETFEDGRPHRDFYSKANSSSITDSRTVTIDSKLDLTWQLGSINEIKAGLQYKKHRLSLYNIDGVRRPLRLQYIDNYFTDKPFEAAGYIQDKIELSYLIINLGLRYDYMNSNVSFRQNPLDPNSLLKVKSRSQISPRIGIAHPISDRTKLHFSYGYFFQNPNYNRLFENKEYKISVREPIFGTPNLDAERTVSYEVGISHQFSERIAMSLVAHYRDITGLIGTTYLFPYVEGRYIGYTLYVNEDYANSKGFELNLDIRPDKYFSGGLTYTYSVAKGSASSETEQYPGTSESTLLYYLDFDKTHVVNASATFTIPAEEGPIVFGKPIFEDMDLSVIFRAGSGYPYTPSGRDVGFVVRNSLRMPATYSIDLEIGKEIILPGNLKLRVFAEILNLTNHQNVLYVYTDTGDPEYTLVGARSIEYQRDPSNYGPPRSIRLGMGMRF